MGDHIKKHMGQNIQLHRIYAKKYSRHVPPSQWLDFFTGYIVVGKDNSLVYG